MTEAEIKRCLVRTWTPFFSRFGRFTEVQRRAIPPVLEGRNVLVISPSASGKTEAIIAPVVERLLPDRCRGLRVLYVSPTRALVNDLSRRLTGPFEYLGLELDRKTGDRPQFDSGRPPFALITTPESFDSLLCRRPAAFRDLDAVILDELHLLDNTPRGDQLRVLLERLRRIRTGLRFHALSATVENDALGSRYFGEPVSVKVAESRRIEYRLLARDNQTVSRLYRELRARRLEKVLCFFNARSLAEMYSRALDRPPFAGKCWVHHASMTKQQREETERLMTSERRGVLCATSTLELGIDIGDIDAVVLFRPPFSVSSLLQRIGRGNRRTGESLFAVGIYENDWERFLFEAMFDAARSGRLFEKQYRPGLAVLPQQTFSYLFQRRRVGTTLRSLERVLAPLDPDPETLRTMFRQLVTAGQVQAVRPGIYQVSAALERETTRGKIHSNIQEKSFGDFEVVESETGRVIGRIFFLFNRFTLAGRAWEVVERRECEKRVIVRGLGRVESATKVFEGTGTGGYGHRFARFLKSRAFPELEPDEFPFFREHGMVYLYHFLGELNAGLLVAALGESGQEIEDLGGRVFAWPERFGPIVSGTRGFPVPKPAELRSVVAGQITTLEDRLGSGAFLRVLPRALQVEDVFRALDGSGLLSFLRGLLVREVTPEIGGRQMPREKAQAGRDSVH
jgi:ATP-dependent Lhr-like helicase